MKRSKKMISALLFSGMLLAGTVPAAAAEGDVINADVESSGKTVTLTLELAENKELSSGRVVVFYDDELLTLSDETEGNLWDAEDVNPVYTEDGKTGVSYAWASKESSSAGGELVTLTFTAKDEADGETAAFEIVSAELYSGTEALPEAGEKVEKTAEIVFNPAPEETETEEETEQDTEEETEKESEKKPDKDKAEVKPNNNSQSTSTSDASKKVESTDTGDHSNVAALVLILSAGCIVLAYAGRKKL